MKAPLISRPASMRLLQLQPDNGFITVDFKGRSVPGYAILSHTWGKVDDEVSLKDFSEGTARSKAGYEKLAFCGKQAAKHGLQYFWIDTCCIDSTSSEEVTEAVNSMFQWFRQATICFAYLTDVSVDGDTVDESILQHAWKSKIPQSKWFTRGWTLLELLAPSKVTFFSREGTAIGEKHLLQQDIHTITGIPLEALAGKPLSTFNVDEKMSWTRKRQTTRDEDMAYCLLGIFDVHMPLAYGEGKEQALKRLHESIGYSKQAGSEPGSGDTTVSKRPNMPVEPKVLIAAVDNNGCTPFYLACLNGHVKVAEVLLEAGADLSVTTKIGLTPIYIAANNGHIEVAKLLLARKVDVNQPAANNYTPLNAAADSGHLEMVQLLLDNGADLSIANSVGQPPLYRASLQGHIKVVELLLSKGADLAVRSDSGWTPLAAAAENGHVNVVKFLLDKGLNANIGTTTGQTPLYRAALQGHIEILKLLLSNGADPSLKTDNGWTPMNAAADDGRVDVVKVLLDHGDDATIATDSGRTPLMTAAAKGHVEVVELLLKPRSNPA